MIRRLLALVAQSRPRNLRSSASERAQRSDEAIYRPACGAMDCFAALAM